LTTDSSLGGRELVCSRHVPLAASLGLTFSYNVTIGIPLYIEIARIVGHWFPGT
jgi:hypothetical protein